MKYYRIAPNGNVTCVTKIDPETMFQYDKVCRFGQTLVVNGIMRWSGYWSPTVESILKEKNVSIPSKIVSCSEYDTEGNIIGVSSLQDLAANLSEIIRSS